MSAITREELWQHRTKTIYWICAVSPYLFGSFFYGSLLFGGQNDFYVLVNGRGEASAVLFCGAYHSMNFSPPPMKNAPDKQKKVGKVAGKLPRKTSLSAARGSKIHNFGQNQYMGVLLCAYNISCDGSGFAACRRLFACEKCTKKRRKILKYSATINRNWCLQKLGV